MLCGGVMTRDSECRAGCEEKCDVQNVRAHLVLSDYRDRNTEQTNLHISVLRAHFASASESAASGSTHCGLTGLVSDHCGSTG